MGTRKQKQTQVYQSLALITQFGITMLVPIGLCSFAGWYLDSKLGTDYLFVIMFFVGALAGFRNIYILARKVYERTDETADDYAKVRSDLASGKNSKQRKVHISKKGDGKNA